MIRLGNAVDLVDDSEVYLLRLSEVPEDVIEQDALDTVVLPWPREGPQVVDDVDISVYVDIDIPISQVITTSQVELRRGAHEGEKPAKERRLRSKVRGEKQSF